MMRYADVLGDWLRELGYTHCFFVAGGGIMHLLDSFRTRFHCIPVVHEMSAGICAEHFNECAGDGSGRAFALVTTGPGLTNIVTAVAGCYVEHRELLVIAGQVKSSDLLVPPQRQRGVQEIDGRAICAPITIASVCLRTPMSRGDVQTLVQRTRGPHPGPVVLEICLDVQGASVDPDVLGGDEAPAAVPTLEPDATALHTLRGLVSQAKRPLILMGGLVTRGAAQRALSALEQIGIPTATTTSAIDRIPTDSPVFAGRPGTWGGQRAGNLVVAQADLVIALGAQLDLQQTGFSFFSYAPRAQLVHVFPSRHELDRSGPPAVLKIEASPDLVLAHLIESMQGGDYSAWRTYVQQVRALVPPLEPANLSREPFINSFAFLQQLSLATDSSDILALCSSGGTFTGALQSYHIAVGQIATTSAAHASMGYGLATAIGAAISQPDRRVVLTEGEGGFSQNLQELALVGRGNLPIKMFLLENGGYASIRATQRKFFKGSYLGCDPQTGLGFPDWVTLFQAYGIPCRTLSPHEAHVEYLRSLMNERPGPEAWIVPVDPEQPNWPAVSTVLSADGSLTSAPLYDMLPPLTETVLQRVGAYLPTRG